MGPVKATQTPSFLSLVFLFQFPFAFFTTWLLDLLGQQFLWGAPNVTVEGVGPQG